MEKAKINRIKFFIFYFSIMFSCLFLNYLVGPETFKKIWPTVTVTFFIGTGCLLALANIYDKDKSGIILADSIYFSCFIKKKEHLVKWNDLIVISISKARYLPLRIISLGKRDDQNFHYELHFKYWTQEGLIELIKKYTPKDHDLYKMTKEHYPKYFL